MKKYCYFIVSLVTAMSIFAAVSLCSFYFSLDKKQAETKLNSEGPEKSTNNKAEFICVYKEDRMYISVINVDFYNQEVSGFSVDPENKISGKSLLYIYDNYGINSFAEGCNRICGGGDRNFIELNAVSFAVFADRVKSLVYNKDDNEYLLTGIQAVDMMSQDNFTEFSCKIVEEMIRRDIKSEFIYATNLCNNNFSYPYIYKTAKLEKE